MRYETLQVERRGPVGWLRFDRPDSGNAINATMFDELEAAWAELDADPDVTVIVNTGNGSSFQTGLDVIESTTPEEPSSTLDSDVDSSSGSGSGARASPRAVAG